MNSDSMYIQGWSAPGAVAGKSQEMLVEEPIPLNITLKHIPTYATLTYLMGVVDLLATAMLLWIIYITNTHSHMKSCEKVLICNALLPDLALEIFLLTVVSPAILDNVWNYGRFQTRWLAFLHTTCIYHSHFAMSLICYAIAISLTDIYRFESANNMPQMSALFVASMTVTVCICSLPATEEEGYVFLHNWMSPAFNIRAEYGSSFTALAMMSIIMFLFTYSMTLLYQARLFFQAHLEKLSIKALADLDKVIIFTCVAICNALLLIPTIVGSSSKPVMFAYRVPVYLAPVCRVFTLLFFCPHFQFALFNSGQQYGVEDLAVLDFEETREKEKQQLIAKMFDDEEAPKATSSLRDNRGQHGHTGPRDLPAS